MMKKIITLLLTGCLLLSMTACSTTKDVNAGADLPETTPTSIPAPATKTVTPLPVTIDVNNLTDCTVAVSIEKEDLSLDNTGARVLPVTVYTYDLYDMVDIAMMAPGDTIILRGEEVLVTELVRTDSGAVQINGGLDAGGYELRTDEHTVYY